MEELTPGTRAGDIRDLDAAASDARGLARRANRLRERVIRLEDPEATAQAEELQQLLERLARHLDGRRESARRSVRDQLRRSGGDPY